jgi:hypothetical protein
MPLDFRFGDIGHDVLFDRSGGFEVVAAAVAAFLGMDIVLDENRVGGRFGSKATRMFTVFFPAPVFGLGLAIRAGTRTLATLADFLQFVLQLRNPCSQFRVFRFEGTIFLLKPVMVVHDLDSMRMQLQIG